MKECSTCRLKLSLDEFYESKYNKGGYYTICKSCARKRNKKYRLTHKATKEQKRKWRIKSKYGITQEEYEQLYIAANGACEICHKELDVLYIDHNHDTGKVRGLLCRGCNTGIGMLQEDISTLLKAIKYLESK